MTSLELIVYFDGAARSNPRGEASYGVWCELSDGTFAWGDGAPLGVRTNNEAEFEALLAALVQCAEALRAFPTIARVRVRGDSELVVDAMMRRKRVHAANLRPLLDEAHRRAGALGRAIRFKHVRRARNRVADTLANRALDLRRRVTEADL